VPEANQGVGVDERHFYAVDNRAIAVTTKRRRAREEVGGAHGCADHAPRQRDAEGGETMPRIRTIGWQ
jgi:hypothetical protein